MKYIAAEEQQRLLDKHQVKSGELVRFLASLTRSVEQIFQLCEEIRIYDVKELLLHVKDRTVDQIMPELEKRLDVLGLAKKASEIKASINNIQTLQKSSQPLIDTTAIINEHLGGIVNRLQQEKRQFVEALYNSFMEDAEKNQKGETVAPKASQTYKLLNSLK